MGEEGKKGQFGSGQGGRSKGCKEKRGTQIIKVRRLNVNDEILSADGIDISKLWRVARKSAGYANDPSLLDAHGITNRMYISNKIRKGGKIQIRHLEELAHMAGCRLEIGIITRDGVGKRFAMISDPTNPTYVETEREKQTRAKMREVGKKHIAKYHPPRKSKEE